MNCMNGSRHCIRAMVIEGNGHDALHQCIIKPMVIQANTMQRNATHTKPTATQRTPNQPQRNAHQTNHKATHTKPTRARGKSCDSAKQSKRKESVQVEVGQVEVGQIPRQQPPLPRGLPTCLPPLCSTLRHPMQRLMKQTGRGGKRNHTPATGRAPTLHTCSISAKLTKCARAARPNGCPCQDVTLGTGDACTEEAS